MKHVKLHPTEMGEPSSCRSLRKPPGQSDPLGFDWPEEDECEEGVRMEEGHGEPQPHGSSVT